MNDNKFSFVSHSLKILSNISQKECKGSMLLLDLRTSNILENLTECTFLKV